jgi:hypothetical protein
LDDEEQMLVKRDLNEPLENTPSHEVEAGMNRIAESELVEALVDNNHFLEDRDLGLQLEACTSFIALTIPYWHDDKTAKVAFAKIDAIFAVLNKNHDWLIYDPQEDQVKTQISGATEVRMYGGVVEKLKGLLGWK